VAARRWQQGSAVRGDDAAFGALPGADHGERGPEDPALGVYIFHSSGMASRISS
jgi:hypothetical protein